ncbi:MAG: hypothetical protein WD377_09000, partial [Nitriliruptoraceae bacterium]
MRELLHEVAVDVDRLLARFGDERSRTCPLLDTHRTRQRQVEGARLTTGVTWEQDIPCGVADIAEEARRGLADAGKTGLRFEDRRVHRRVEAAPISRACLAGFAGCRDVDARGEHPGVD